MNFRTALFSALAAAILTAPAPAQNTSFTYQGRLTADGAVVDGTVDLQFLLYDAPVGGAQMGPIIDAPGHAVDGGLFTVSLAFGPAAFDGTARWLEIIVDGAAMSPRQPYNTWSMETRGLTVDAAGNLDVNGVVEPNGIRFAADTQGIQFPNAIGATAPMITMYESSGGNASRMVLGHSPAATGWGLRDNDALVRFEFVQDGAPRATFGLSYYEASVRAVQDPLLSWGIIVENPTQPDYITGMFVTPAGFFQITNKIDGGQFARLDSSGTWTVASDRRLKKDIAPLTPVLDDVLALEPVTYQYRSQSDDERHIGFIAQDVQTHFPSFVTVGETLTLDYAGLSTLAIAALQEQQKIIDALTARLDRLEATLVSERGHTP